MGRVIAVANQKGGVGKTTTAINLSACLAEKGKKVLAVDMDPQGNMTSGLGVDKDSVENTIYNLIIGESKMEEVLIKDVLENLDIIPTNIDLSGAEIELLDVEEKEYIEKHPEYGRIICRCETISEGEILDAIRRSPKPVSLDGIKRRCNAGMGRCQSGFCGPRVQEILANELGVSQLDIVLDKNGSYILCGRTKENGDE